MLTRRLHLPNTIGLVLAGMALYFSHVYIKCNRPREDARAAHRSLISTSMRPSADGYALQAPIDEAVKRTVRCFGGYPHQSISDEQGLTSVDSIELWNILPRFLEYSTVDVGAMRLSL